MARPKMTWQERERWEAEQTALAQGKFKAIAGLLGWTCQQDERRSANITKGKYTVHCYFDSYHNRIALFGRFPIELSRHKIDSGMHADPECRITVAPGKTPERIVSDLQARLLPSYTALWKELEERNRRYTARENAQDNLAEGIAKHGRGKTIEPTHYSKGDIYRRAIVYFGAQVTSGAPWGKAEISSYGNLHATMELHNIPPELAEYIASLLGEWAEDEDNKS